MMLSYFLQLLVVFPYFLFAVGIACYIPGSLIVRKINLGNLQRFVLSLGLGIILWGWQGYLFGFLHIRWMTYVYILVALLFWIKPTDIIFSMSYKKIKDVFLGNRWSILLILIGSFIYCSTIFFVGVPAKQGLYNCCGNTWDNFLQIAITRAVVENIPPKEPGITGSTLKNYHYWSGLVNGELIRVFHLPLIPTEYQYMTILLSLLLGLAILALGFSLKLPKSFSNWLLFFLYFGGDLIFLVVFAFTHYLTFNMSSMEDGSKFLVNYPRAFAIVLFFIALISFVEMLRQKKNKTLAVITAVMMGSLVGYKVYIGIFALVGLWTYASFNLLRRQYIPFVLTIFATFLSLCMYLPVNAGAGGLYFIGMWRFENFIVQPYLQATRLEMARLIYVHDHKWLKVYLYEAMYVLTFIIGNFGTKLIGLVQTKKSLRLIPGELHIFLASGLIVSAMLGFFFEQTSGGSNTFNFLVSVFIIGSIYTALTCTYFLTKLPKKLAVALIAIIILLTIPRVIVETFLNTSRVVATQGYIIPNQQIDFLSNLHQFISPSGQLIVDHSGAFNMDYESPYVYIYSGGNMYFSGIHNEIDSHNIPAKAQEAAVKVLTNSNNLCTVGGVLLQSPAHYLISDGNTYFSSTRSAQFLDPLYRNGVYTLYKINDGKIRKFLYDAAINPLEDPCQ